MIIDKEWSELYQKRLDWAYRAKDKFIKSLKNNDFKALSTNENYSYVNVILYGNTQVGKTTLSLKLLGIDKDYFQIIYKLIRAGSKHGNPATKTSMVYQKSDDEHFYYYTDTDKEPQKSNLKQISSKLIELKNRVDRKEQTLSKVIYIKIPSKYFTKQKTQALDVNIIDLPGVESCNQNERIYVERIIHELVPSANLILLVDRVDQIAHFDKLNIPEVNDWQDFPERFRVVLTHTATTGSINEKIEMNEICCKEDLMVFINEKFSKDIPDNKVTIYPLDFSIESGMKLDKDYYNRVKDWFAKYESELIKDINDSSNEYNHLTCCFKYYKSIKKIIEPKKNEFEERIKKKEDKKKENISKIKEFKKGIKNKNKQKKDLNTKKEIIEDLKKERFDSIETPNFENCKKRTADCLKKEVNKYRDNIIYKAQKYIEDFNNKYHNNRIKKLNLRDLTQTKEYQSTIKQLHNRRKLLSKLFYSNKKFISDKKECRNSCKSISRKIERIIKSHVQKTIKKHFSDYKDQKKEIETKIKDYKYQIDELEKFKNKITKEIISIKSKYGKYKEQADKDLETAKRFCEFVNIEFNKEIININNKINSKSRKSELKILDLFYISLIESEYRKIVGVQ